MKIYDISQELFGCVVFPGDPAPKREILGLIKDGSYCNLTAFSMCAHNGTHVDAPFHFIDDGKTIDGLDLHATVGWAYVADCNGLFTADDAKAVMEKAGNSNVEASKRILLKGKTTVTLEAARFFAENNVLLVGNQSQTVGPEDGPIEVHKVLLGAGVVLLEGIRLENVKEGVYLLSATPINLGGSDGAPCRAVLIEM